MDIDLCQPLTFVPYPVNRFGRTVLEFISIEKTRVTPDNGTGVGDCHHVCAELAFDRSLGVLRVAFQSCGVLCVSDFAVLKEVEDIGEPALGTLVSPGHGVICGSITIWTTTSSCMPDITLWDDCGREGVRDACFFFPPDGLACIFCADADDSDCTIEQEDWIPCSVDGGGGHGAIAAPGAIITPDATSYDIFGDADRFTADDGVTGLVRYQIKPFTGSIDMHPPDPTWGGVGQDGQCCTWLCRWFLNNTEGYGWQVRCASPQQVYAGNPPLPDTTPQELAFTPYGGQIVFLHFAFTDEQLPCFQLTNQMCFTGGDDEDASDDWWEHLDSGDMKLIVLGSLMASFNCRVSPDPDKYPHREPEYIEIVNDALAEFANGNPHYVSRTDGRMHKYDSSVLNLWRDQQAIGGDACDAHPVVHHGGDPNGAPWKVYVIPYGTDCRFPAELVLWGFQVELRLSGDPESERLGEDETAGGIRIAATLNLWLDLRARLLDGWQDLDCPIGFVNDDPCDLITDPQRHIVVASDNCSQVPLRVHWRGIQGPWPWSRGPFEYVEGVDWVSPCCDTLCALDGLIIPGAVNDTSDPRSPQRNEGDVVIGLQLRPTELGCGECVQ